MKRTTIFLILAICSGTLAAQSLSVSVAPSPSENLNADISGDKVEIKEQDGKLLISGDYRSFPDDPSLKTYPLKNGAFIVRENISNFLIYDSFGKIQKTISNSTLSKDGEVISELAMDDYGKTIVLFNPKVLSNGNEGSRGKVITTSSVPLDLYFSEDRTLSVVEVSPNGQFIAFASVKPGTEDEVQLTDKFGNLLNDISFDQDVKGVSFSENGLYVTIYSGGRAAAYEIRSGERVGSTSFRNTTLIFAGYDPIDKTIIGLSGDEGSSISNVQLHAVNIPARKIARENLSGNLTIIGQIVLERTASGSYSISGLDKELSFQAGF